MTQTLLSGIYDEAFSVSVLVSSGITTLIFFYCRNGSIVVEFNLVFEVEVKVLKPDNETVTGPPGKPKVDAEDRQEKVTLIQHHLQAEVNKTATIGGKKEWKIDLNVTLTLQLTEEDSSKDVSGINDDSAEINNDSNHTNYNSGEEENEDNSKETTLTPTTTSPPPTTTSTATTTPTTSTTTTTTTTTTTMSTTATTTTTPPTTTTTYTTPSTTRPTTTTTEPTTYSPVTTTQQSIVCTIQITYVDQSCRFLTYRPTNSGCSDPQNSTPTSSCNEGKVFDFDADPFQFDKSCTEDETKPANDDFSLTCEPDSRYRKYNCSLDAETTIFVKGSEIVYYGEGQLQQEYIDACCKEGCYYDEDSEKCEKRDDSEDSECNEHEHSSQNRFS